MISERFLQRQIIYAGFFTRIIASIIDCFLYMILFNPLINLLNNVIYRNKVAPNIFWPRITDKFLKANDGKINLANFHIYVKEISNYLFKENMIFPILLSQITQLILILIIILIFWSKKQATPGKMLMRIKITNYEYGSLNLKQYLIRIFGLMLTFMSLGLGYVTILFSKKKQAMHDLISKSLVIKV